MIRKLVVCLLTAVFLPTAFLAEAQQPDKVYRVGFLRFGTGGPTTSGVYMGLRQGLRRLRYIEGKNLVLEYRSAERKPEQRPKMAAELARLGVDVIVIPGARGLIRAAQRATQTIPIVVSGFRVDPVEAGYIESIRRPGGNMTGLTNFESELHDMRLELLKEAFPRISRVVILWPADHQKDAMKEVEATSEALGMQIRPLIVAPPYEHQRAFSAIIRERPDGLIVATSALTLTSAHRARFIEFAAKNRLPTIYSRSLFVDAGGLMSYGADLQHLYRRAATYVDKILKGTKPADLPVEGPTKFELMINLKTAKELGITIPPTVLYRADKVIK